MEQHGLKHEEITEKIIGVFFDVYNELGYGFLETVYEKSMLVALKATGLHAKCQVPVPVWFRGVQVGDFFADILVEDKVMLELKAARALDKAHEAQLLNYLKGPTLKSACSSALASGQNSDGFFSIMKGRRSVKIRVNPWPKALHFNATNFLASSIRTSLSTHA